MAHAAPASAWHLTLPRAAGDPPLPTWECAGLDASYDPARSGTAASLLLRAVLGVGRQPPTSTEHCSLGDEGLSFLSLPWQHGMESVLPLCSWLGLPLSHPNRGDAVGPPAPRTAPCLWQPLLQSSWWDSARRTLCPALGNATPGQAACICSEDLAPRCS